jgi:hypothetical protein
MRLAALQVLLTRCRLPTLGAKPLQHETQSLIKCSRIELHGVAEMGLASVRFGAAGSEGPRCVYRYLTNEHGRQPKKNTPSHYQSLRDNASSLAFQ